MLLIQTDRNALLTPQSATVGVGGQERQATRFFLKQ